MIVLLGFAMIIGQVIGTVIVFGVNMPKRIRITAGILQILFFIGAITVATK